MENVRGGAWEPQKRGGRRSVGNVLRLTLFHAPTLSRSHNHRHGIPRTKLFEIVQVRGEAFGMVLHTTNRFGLVAHPFDRLVIEIDPIHRHVWRAATRDPRRRP